jgi:hypothetical protein
MSSRNSKRIRSQRKRQARAKQRAADRTSAIMLFLLAQVK